jgi:rhamnose utilization protein RhaD (predicted bifunctional aldolase and dehydrogenase)
VNGMTCGINGKEACAKLFPDALWVDYIDPGYTLCIEVMREIDTYVKKNNVQPKLLFMKNHGVFVAADTVEEMTSLYKDMMEALRKKYNENNVDLVMTSKPAKANIAKKLQQILESYKEINGSTPCVATGNFLELPKQPLTPDHIVYMKAKLFTAEPNVKNLQSFKHDNGYLPLLLISDDGFIAVGETQMSAQLTMTLAMDEAYVLQLSEAFGGVELMTDAAQSFIINWESEAYRKKQS